MRKLLSIWIILMAAAGSTIAQDPLDIIDASKLKFMQKKGDDGTVDYEDGVFTLTTKNQPQFIYKYSTMVRTKPVSLKRNQAVLIVYEAKTESSSLETGEAKVNWVLKQGETYKTNLNSTLSIGSKWQTYYVPFLLSEDVPEDIFKVMIQFGFQPQKIKLKNVHVYVYPVGTEINDLPKTEITYAGMDNSARWRKLALQRIENNRKTQAKVQFLHKGKPIPSKELYIKLKNHVFGWGAAINAEDVVNDTERYKMFKSAFSLAVFENDLKIKSWSKPHQKQRTLKAIDILKNDGITIKGHVLVWPGFNYLPDDFRTNKNDPKKTKEILHDHLKDIISSTKGNISHWDVVNEAYTNRDLQEITGSEDILYEAFRTLHKIDPQPLKYVNEYGIISKGGIDIQKQTWYKEYASRVDSATDHLLDGIGIQSHMGSDLTPPEKVLEILDFYAELGKKISISEFTMEITDPQIRAMYTRDFIIAAFSHPAVSEFLFWGYDDHKNQKAVIFNSDGSLGPMGEVYFGLVKELWNTKLNATTDEEGSVAFKGFFGEYEYSFIENNKLVTGTFTVAPSPTYGISTIMVDID